ncbi:MAG: type II toxin-antitoxin system Phd/YefM family antitoxin [Pseudomonadota bacterium]|uniref:Antitoxin n=1 Tax=Candidatus Desulfatibia profunda TaxID=2841695 RepID=A0A8J6NQ36_9BACT|nr:type II toxin-antitoxin system Phd/YefM family antitoxin [Candidatus Desulfatibia profunda]MBL7181317.1 type II toxin-antitoxin system Phd/YefM family antitoxin [Desulfobacterales bacterium]
MTEKIISVADAKKHFSDLLGQVAYKKQHILITKRGKPMARLIPVEASDDHLIDAHGWLENDDPFFDAIDRIVQERSKHVPRILKETTAE